MRRLSTALGHPSDRRVLFAFDTQDTPDKVIYLPCGTRTVRGISCGQRHREDDTWLGEPLCPDCCDYNAAVVWNAHASELWRRTIIGIRRRVDKLAQAHGVRVRVSFAKVAPLAAGVEAQADRAVPAALALAQ